MAGSNWVIKQGDTLPLFTDTLTLSDGTVPDMSGATVQFVIRNAQMTPVSLSGIASIVEPSTGAVQYAPTATDTSSPGSYYTSWIVTFPSGDQMTFPTIGYESLEVEPSITGGSIPQLLVDLETVKRYPGMSIPANDRHLDTRLTDFIQAVRPLIEQITGPILPTIFEEWHDGGQNYIMLRRRPSTGFGTTPVLNLIACSEYNGPIEWPLAIVASPDQGQMYSCMLDTRLGRVVRRTAGGGVQPFPYQPEAVHVVYQAGQAEVPYNVREAALELIRVNWQTTQPVGRGRGTQVDSLETGVPLGFYIPRRVRELLSPMQKAPSIA